MSFKPLKHAVLGSLLGSLCLGSHAAEPVEKGIVDIRAQVSRTVSNDQMDAVLFIEETAKNSAALVDRINSSFNAAYALARQYPKVKVETRQQQTYPVYDERQKLTGWRIRAELALKTTDFKQGSQLIALLQDKFQLAQITFTPTPDTLAQLENQMISDAITAFRARADRVTRDWGAKGYELVKMEFDNNGYQPPMIRERSYMADSSMKVAAAAPVAQDYQAGNSSIQTTASGTIKLNFR